MTSQFQNQPQQFPTQPGAQGVYQPQPQQAVPGQTLQQPGTAGTAVGSVQQQQQQQGIHPHAGFAGTTGVAGPHTGFAGTGTGTTVDDTHSGSCFGKSNKAATTGATAGSAAAANRAQTDQPTGGTKEKVIGAVEYAIGSALGSERLKAKGLEKEREGDMLRAQLHQTQQQYHQRRGDAHGTVADAFRNQNQPPHQAQTNQLNTTTGDSTSQYPGAPGAHGGQLGMNQQANQDFASAGAGTGALSGAGGTIGHGGQSGTIGHGGQHPDFQARNQAGTQPGDGTRFTESHGVMNHGGQLGVNDPGRGDFQNQTQAGNDRLPYRDMGYQAQDNNNGPNVLQKPNPNAGGNVAV